MTRSGALGFSLESCVLAGCLEGDFARLNRHGTDVLKRGEIWVTVD
jgi:hypothetical protein